MKWNDINNVLVMVHQHGRNFSKRIPRPFEAMPRWFKRYVKRLNQHHDLQANLKLCRRRRRANGNGRRKASPTR